MNEDTFFEGYSIISIHKSFSGAEERIKEIENKISEIKTKYSLEFNSDYDEDLAYVHTMEQIEEAIYNIKAENIYNYQHIHSELNYNLSIDVMELEE